MIKRIASLLLLLTALQVAAQSKVNQTLKKQLDSILVLDQKYRDTLMMLMIPSKADSIAKKLLLKPANVNWHYWKMQSHIDSLDLIFIENVFKRYGYPGKSLVGSPTNESAWNVIQHSDKIPQYIGLIKKAAEHKELPFNLYAMMLDRYLMDQHKEQIYGTQATCQVLKSGKQECFIWPIQNPDQVNKRRKKAGFEMTVEQNAKRLDVNYRVVSMNEVK